MFKTYLKSSIDIALMFAIDVENYGTNDNQNDEQNCQQRADDNPRNSFVGLSDA